jgi:hypothetical protein
MAQERPRGDDGREPHRDVPFTTVPDTETPQVRDAEARMPHGTDPETQMTPQGRPGPRCALPIAILIVVVIVIWALAV